MGLALGLLVSPESLKDLFSWTSPPEAVRIYGDTPVGPRVIWTRVNYHRKKTANYKDRRHVFSTATSYHGHIFSPFIVQEYVLLRETDRIPIHKELHIKL